MCILPVLVHCLVGHCERVVVLTNEYLINAHSRTQLTVGIPQTPLEKDVKIPKIANNSAGSGAGGHHHHHHQLLSQKSSAITTAEEPKSPTIGSVPTFRRFSRSNSLTGTLPGQLPRFYFPNGRPYSSHEVESQIKRIISVFERFPSRTVTRKELGGVLKLVGVPVYWKVGCLISIFEYSNL